VNIKPLETPKEVDPTAEPPADGPVNDNAKTLAERDALHAELLDVLACDPPSAEYLAELAGAASGAEIFATYYSKVENTYPLENVTGPKPWGSFAAELRRFGHHGREEKDGTLVSLVQLKPGTSRKDANSLQATGWSLDLDKATAEQIAETRRRLDADGLAYTLYSTHSHDPKKGKLKLRIMGPLAAPVLATAWKPVWRAIIEKYAPWTDAQCKDISRGWYTPACPKSRKSDAQMVFSPGRALDPGKLPVSVPAGPRSAGRGGDLNAAEIIDNGTRVPRAPKGSNPLAHAVHLAQSMPVADAKGEHHGTALFKAARALVWGLELTPDVATTILLDHYASRIDPAVYVADEANVQRRCENAEADDDQAAYKRGALLPPPPDSFEHLPLIVSHDGVFWIRGTGSDDYGTRTRTERNLLIWLRSIHPDEDISEEIEVKNLLDTIKPISEMRACYFVDKSLYDPATLRFVQGLRTDRALVPQHDNDVDLWLTAMAGDKADDLKMWIASCRPDRLNSPARALGLIGAFQVGKTLFASSLARIWGEAYVKASVLTAQFNGALSKSPIVFADEALPRDLSGEAFRDLIQCRVHSIEMKGKERFTLEGCIRMIVAANDISKLYLAGEKGADDIAAIANRFFTIQIADPDLVRETQRALIVDGSNADVPRIARHFLWLMNTVDPGSDGRFIGPGEDTDSRAIVETAELEREPELFGVLQGVLASGQSSPQRGVFLDAVTGDVSVEAGKLGAALDIRKTSGDVLRALKMFRLGKRTSTSFDGTVFYVHRLDGARLRAALCQ
jgi:hypothetical protein